MHKKFALTKPAAIYFQSAMKRTILGFFGATRSFLGPKGNWAHTVAQNATPTLTRNSIPSHFPPNRQTHCTPPFRQQSCIAGFFIYIFSKN
ncbi:MAG: hypothetical protein Q7S10_03020 [bacterium]|nr:hypothetical protein [bacterium]